jgi:hypothetical protein
MGERGRKGVRRETPEQAIERYLSGILRLNPAFNRDWITASRSFAPPCSAVIAHLRATIPTDSRSALQQAPAGGDSASSSRLCGDVELKQLRARPTETWLKPEGA